MASVRSRGAAVAAVAAVVLALVWWSDWPGGSTPADVDVSVSSPHPSGDDAATPPRTPAGPARRASSDLGSEAPVSARLPSGAAVPIRSVSTRANGVLDVPDDIRTAGWWRGGARLGDPFGSTLLAAHVDSTTQGLGPYVELLSVRAGQRVVVTSTHLRQAFRISSLRLVPQGSLAGEPQIYAPGGRRRLTLVTCAPPYDAARGGYQNLAVVTATPDGPPTRRNS